MSKLKKYNYKQYWIVIFLLFIKTSQLLLWYRNEIYSNIKKNTVYQKIENKIIALRQERKRIHDHLLKIYYLCILHVKCLKSFNTDFCGLTTDMNKAYFALNMVNETSIWFPSCKFVIYSERELPSLHDISISHTHSGCHIKLTKEKYISTFMYDTYILHVVHFFSIKRNFWCICYFRSKRNVKLSLEQKKTVTSEKKSLKSL